MLGVNYINRSSSSETPSTQSLMFARFVLFARTGDREGFDQAGHSAEVRGQAPEAEPGQEEKRYPEASGRQLLLSADTSSNCTCGWKRGSDYTIGGL